MSAKTATLAKSLHTVSVIANVARRELVLALHDDAPISVEHAVQCAMATLGYSDAADPYGLIGKATAILEKEVIVAVTESRGAARTVGTWDGMSERPGYC
jgi:hypothetical protein